MGRLNILKDNYFLLFAAYAVVLSLFVAFSYKIIFHDTWEYISLTEKLAGFFKSDVFIVHSLVYPFFLSFLLKAFPSVLTMKLANVLWSLLIGLVLYKECSKKSAFLIWAFSPIAWMVSPIISPLFPASFFILLAYVWIKKWEEYKERKHLVLSAFALGLAAAVYDLGLVIALIFVLSFFYNQRFKKVIAYVLIVFLAFSIRLIIDASFFSIMINDKILPFPIYTLIRFWGAITVIQLGLHSMIPVSKISLLANISSWTFLVVISPLTFLIYKVNMRKNRSVMIFLALSTLLFLFQGGGFLYFFLIAPIVVMLLIDVLGKKEIIIHAAMSCLLIVLLTYPYFVQDKEEIKIRNMTISDIKSVSKDFSFNAAVLETDTLARLYIFDKNTPYLLTKSEYEKALQTESYYTYYSFRLGSKIGLDRKLEVSAGMKSTKNENIDYNSLPFLIKKGEVVPEGYKQTKCYSILCVYEKTV